MDRTFLLTLRATGVNPQKDRVMELCVAPFIRGNGAHFHTLVNPCESVPSEILAMHGFNMATLSRAPPFSMAFDSLMQWLSPDSHPFTILMAHNGHKYHWPLMTHELHRSKRKVESKIWLWDTIHLCHKLYSVFLPSMRLYDIYAVFYPSTPLHNPTARQDIEILRRIVPLVAQKIARAQSPLSSDVVYKQIEATNEEMVAITGGTFKGSNFCVNSLQGQDWPKLLEVGKGSVSACSALKERLEKFNDTEYDLNGNPQTSSDIRTLRALLDRREARENAGEAVPVYVDDDDGRQPVDMACDLLTEAAVYLEKALQTRKDGVQEIRCLAGLIVRLCS